MSTQKEQTVILTTRIPLSIKRLLHAEALKQGHGRDSIVTRAILNDYYLGKK